jgi:hypothetical protein
MTSAVFARRSTEKIRFRRADAARHEAANAAKPAACRGLRLMTGSNKFMPRRSFLFYC